MGKVVLTSARTRNFLKSDIDNTVWRAFDLLDYDFGGGIQRVVIKPNLCYYWDYSTGETTDPRVVSAVIDYVRDHAGKDVSVVVAEADASAMRTKYSFKILGYEELCRAKDVGLVNLSRGDIVDVKVEVGSEELELPVNKLLLEADLIVNVPKLKSHRVAGITCCFKNMFGAIAKPRKYVYHRILSDVIVGINKIVKSDICLVDGLIARGSRPKKLGVVIAGGNALAADFVAAKVMGHNPEKIPHLRLAMNEIVEENFEIDLIEDHIQMSDIEKAFPKRHFLLNKISWKLQLKLLSTYSAVVGDVIPPILKG